jgi:hypothetical protein
MNSSTSSFDLLMAEEGDLRMFYAPLDSVNESARLIILGITPGWTQMELACRTARAALFAGKAMVEACLVAKQKASFAGSMRANLIRMLDTLGLPSLLQIESTIDLFGSAAHLLHAGSALRYHNLCGIKELHRVEPDTREVAVPSADGPRGSCTRTCGSASCRDRTPRPVGRGDTGSSCH